MTASLLLWIALGFGVAAIALAVVAIVRSRPKRVAFIVHASAPLLPPIEAPVTRRRLARGTARSDPASQSDRPSLRPSHARR